MCSLLIAKEVSFRGKGLPVRFKSASRNIKHNHPAEIRLSVSQEGPEEHLKADERNSRNSKVSKVDEGLATSPRSTMWSMLVKAPSRQDTTAGKGNLVAGDQNGMVDKLRRSRTAGSIRVEHSWRWALHFRDAKVQERRVGGLLGKLVTSRHEWSLTLLSTDVERPRNLELNVLKLSCAEPKSWS